MPASEITLAELVAGQGYHTTHIGKWHLGRANGIAPNDQGFHESLLMASGLYLPEDHPEVINSKQDFDPIDRFLWAVMRSLDRGVGRVLDALQQNGLEENTLVMFTSDNGGAGYIGLPGVNSPFRGWKITLFEGGIHVPYFAKWPARIAPGTEMPHPVHHFDLFATAAAAAGAMTAG